MINPIVSIAALQRWTQLVICPFEPSQDNVEKKKRFIRVTFTIKILFALFIEISFFDQQKLSKRLFPEQ